MLVEAITLWLKHASAAEIKRQCSKLAAAESRATGECLRLILLTQASVLG